MNTSKGDNFCISSNQNLIVSGCSDQRSIIEFDFNKTTRFAVSLAPGQCVQFLDEMEATRIKVRYFINEINL